MISVEFTPEEAQATINFMKRALASLEPQHPDYDQAVDAYTLLRDKIKAGKPIPEPKQKRGKSF